MGQNLLNLLQQTWPRGLAAQYCLGGTSTNLMSQKMNAFAIKLSGLDSLYEMQYFFFALLFEALEVSFISANYRLKPPPCPKFGS